jgi:site-specific recombinase XerD
VPDKRLDKGIWKTSTGYRVIVSIGGRLESKRFPPNYSLDALRRWRDDHIRLRRPKDAARGTLEHDVEHKYLPAVRAMPSYTDRVREIRAWLSRFGPRPRWTLRPDELRAQLADWRAAGAAPNTCNHRRSALSHLYSVIDGKAAYNPLRDVPPYKLAPPIKRSLPLSTILQAIRRVRGALTRSRLLVLLWTGMRPSELMRVTASDLDLTLGRCYVRTAKGGPPREIALNKSAIKAFKRFARLDAWGPFSVSSLRKSLRVACRKAPAITLFRVYDLRHSFAYALRAAGADLSDIQHALGHTDISLTRRYAHAVPEKLRRATDDVRKDWAKERKFPACLSTTTQKPRKTHES